MKTIRILAAALAALLLLSACQTPPSPAAPDEPAVTAADVPVEQDTPEEPESVEEPEDSEEEIDDMMGSMQISGPTPGYYVVSSVMVDGDLSFFGTPDPTEGYLLLNDDNSGTMLYNGTEAPLTWDDENVYWCDKTLPCMVMSYYDPELGREDSMIYLYLLEEATSICFRPAAEHQ